jgi:uncharacterized membrane protein YhaH (DUF805 family)
MPLSQLLFSFKGRIQRLYWWVATIAVGAAAGAATTILNVAAKAAGQFEINPDTQFIEPTEIFGAAVAAVGLTNLWINYALSVKRLHDRDRTGWWLLAQVSLLILTVFLVVLAVALSEGGERSAWWIVAVPVFVAAFVLSVWLTVQIGFLKGTQGPNRYGPDPLGAAQADAKLS